MSAHPLTVVGLGELLWDLLPSGRQLGGAPANFAYHADRLGDRGLIASRVGVDTLGQAAGEQLARRGLAVATIQRDPLHPTGTVAVTVDANGQPSYTIATAVAWDYLAWTADWQRLAASADVVCYGSLAQRAPVARATIHRFLAATRPEALRVFDVNLRQHFYSAAVLTASLRAATLVKLNDAELPLVVQRLGLGGHGLDEQAQRLVATYGLELLCLTRGAAGSLLVTPTARDEHPGIAVMVADTIGAGDAFTAALVHHWRRGASLVAVNAAANQRGAWVASQVGGMPD